MDYEFSAPVWYWRGPAPFYFVTVPADIADEIAAQAAHFTYGWGMIPIEGSIGGVDFTTALFAKDGGYVMPLKKALRTACGFDVDDEVAVSFRPVGATGS